jgi:NADPH-dependent 2,4-dienoyl-CoA reductase/sulfur reductase-like enzyme
MDDGAKLDYGALVIATGAFPVPLPATIHDGAKVHYLRTLADSRAIIEASKSAKRAVIIGASFIGLEVAAALRARDVEIHVVAPEKLPLARILGDALGTFVRDLHQRKGVTFHLGRTAKEVEAGAVVLDDGTRLAADMIVAGIGVRPDTSLAEAAGLAVDKGIVVDAYLRTKAKDVYAAGDAARWPDPRTGRPTRVEHWVVAERLGQAVARNILGMDEPWTAAPFFWSQHYDTVISYVGHAESWERIEIDGDPAEDCAVRYFDEDGLAAVATISRDEQSLHAEMQMEDENQARLEDR